MQISLVRILEHLHTFEGRSKFTSWAISIAMRAAFNELRRKQWNDVSLDELKERQGGISEENDPSPDPSEESGNREFSGILRSIIENELTPRQRDVMLCELSGMPQEEIARQLGSNRNAVYKLFHDSRRAIRRALEARGLGWAEITRAR